MSKKNGPTRAPARAYRSDERDANIKAPIVDESDAEVTTSLSTLASGSVMSDDIDAKLAKGKVTKTLTGGTLPLIKFQKGDEQKGFVGRLVRRTVAKDAKADDPYYFLSFDIMDVDALVADPKDPDGAVRARAQLLETTGLVEWASDPKSVGIVVKLVYQGDSKPSKPGWSGMQHYTIEALDFGVKK